MHLPYQCGFKQRNEMRSMRAYWLNLINNNFLIFSPRIFPFLMPTYPKNPKICNPILVTLLKMRLHYTHSSRENATPSSDTSLLGSCKGVPPPPPPGLSTNLVKFQDAHGKWIVADAGKAAYKLLWTKWWGNRKGRSLEGYDNKLLSFFFRWSLRQSIWHEL